MFMKNFLDIPNDFPWLFFENFPWKSFNILKENQGKSAFAIEKKYDKSIRVYKNATPRREPKLCQVMFPLILCLG